MCCGGSNLFAARAIDKSDGRSLTQCVQTYSNPNAALFKGVKEAPLRVRICEDCGHVLSFVSTQDIELLREGTV